MVVDISNLMRQRALLFKQLEVVETMRAYIVHNMDDSEEIRSKLKSVEGKLVVARKATDEGVGLLRKMEDKRETAKVEALQLKEKMEEMETKHKEIKQKNERLR